MHNAKCAEAAGIATRKITAYSLKSVYKRNQTQNLLKCFYLTVFS